MKRHHIIFTATAIIFFLTLGGARAADLKIGVVDMQRILRESSAGKAAQEEIKAKGKEMEADFKEKGDEVQKIKEKLEKDAMVMNKEMREERERDFRIKLNDLKSLRAKYKEELRIFESAILKRLQDEIYELVGDMGKKEKFTLILEQIGVLYADDAVDVTDQVIKQYNKAFAKK